MTRLPQEKSISRDDIRVVAASAAGSVFEWYDFFLYGSLAAIIGAQYFSYLPETARNIFALLAFAAGFIVRPIGALVFGRLGDRVGRKYTFLLTILLMGLATFAVGLLPNYATIGAAAPIILITLRILQGLALGGEYCGALTYVAEHAPQNRRGFFTSWIQATASLGMLLSLLVILATRLWVGEQEFLAWGWRVPFLVSIVLVAISVYMRLRMSETPAFLKMQAEKRQSAAPVRESFLNWDHLRYALVVLFGLASGLTVIWYTAQFYTLLFLQGVLQIDLFTANVLLAIALCLGVGSYLFFGALSDKIGRKPVLVAGYLLSMASIFPVYTFLTDAANPPLGAAHRANSVQVVADPADCAVQFNPVGTSKFNSSCDIARAHLARNAVIYSMNYQAGTAPARVRFASGADIESFDGRAAAGDALKSAQAGFAKTLDAALVRAGYPVGSAAQAQGVQGKVKLEKLADIFTPRVGGILLALTWLVLLSSMTYAPAGAAMVEMFPTRIRYTAMALPYNIATGWFGGLMPATAFALSVHTGNIYFGLWYPIVILGMSCVVVALFLPNQIKKDIYAQD